MTPLLGKGDSSSSSPPGSSIGSIARSAMTTWILPSVDKDTQDFYSGATETYAWVQTSSIMYLFAPLKQTDSEDRPEVKLEVEMEGQTLNLEVQGQTVLKGRLHYAVKPGEEIWMVEEAPDGSQFVVVELTKVPQGKEWSAVMRPEVVLNEEHDKPKILANLVNDEAQTAAVDATLEHVRRQRATRRKAPEGHEAAVGDLITIDIEGFEVGPDGSRGAPLDAGSATNQRVELGYASSFPKQMLDQLVGITVGATKDVQLTLGGKKPVICAVTCTAIQEQRLPELGDDFAREVKRAEQFVQAGTEEGVPEEEEDLAETFTLSQLRAEIAAEVQREAEATVATDFRQQLEAQMLGTAHVNCDWASNFGLKTSARDAEPPGKTMRDEELAAVALAIAEKHGLLPYLDTEVIKKEAWDVLATPKDPNLPHAEVGADPDRDFQNAHEKVLRQHRLNLVLSWLEERAEVTEA